MSKGNLATDCRDRCEGTLGIPQRSPAGTIAYGGYVSRTLEVPNPSPAPREYSGGISAADAAAAWGMSDSERKIRDRARGSGTDVWDFIELLAYLIVYGVPIGGAVWLLLF